MPKLQSKALDVLAAGLDARAAAIVMRSVRNIVSTGRTIVCEPPRLLFTTLGQDRITKAAVKRLYKAWRMCLFMSCHKATPFLC